MEESADAENFKQKRLLVRNGSVQKVLLKYRKSEDNHRIKPKIYKRQANPFPRISACPEASPPRSPTEQKRFIIASPSCSRAQRVTSRLPDPGRKRSFAEKEFLWTKIRRRIRQVDIPALEIKEDTLKLDAICLENSSNSSLLRDRTKTVIRAPVPWHQQYLVARENCSHNLFLTHPVMIQIRREWNLSYAKEKLFHENHESLPCPAEMYSRVKQRCDLLRTSLVDMWIPTCHKILLRMKHTWSMMIPVKNGESLQQVKRFFNSLTVLLSVQIRSLIYSWIEEWLSILSPYQVSNDFDDYNDSLFKRDPLLKLELSLGQGIQLKPSIEGTQQHLEDCLREILSISLNIPRVEQLLLPDYESAMLFQVDWDEPLITQVRDQVVHIVHLNQMGPVRFIDTVYRQHSGIIDDCSSKIFAQDMNLSWEEKTGRFEDRVRLLDEALRTLSRLKSSVFLNLFYVDCRAINEELLSRTNDYKNSIIKRMTEENKILLRSVSGAFEVVTETASSVPRNTRELVQLADFVRISQTETFSDLTEQVAMAGQRLLFLLGYGVLPKEDVMLNCRLFHWPDDLDSVLKVSTIRLQRHRTQAEKDLKEQTSHFLEKLRDYTAQLETFRKKESASITMEDMRNNCTVLDALHDNLRKSVDQLTDINRDEALLGWEVTHVAALPSLLEHIEPYHQLWHVALEFHDKYDTWYHGPFQNLDSRTISDELERMRSQTERLTAVFCDIAGPKRVADIVQSRIEKFRNLLPLLHAVCNPGLRQRHWDVVSKELGVPIDPEPELSFADLISLGLLKHLPKLEEISATATKELALEEALLKMQTEWDDIYFEYTPYRDSEFFVLTGLEEIQALIDDHILRAQTMHGSPYVGPLEEPLKCWEEKLVMIQDTIEVWLKVQSTWLYLEPIFSSEDIQRQMPGDSMKFSQVNAMWQELMTGVAQQPRVVITATREGLLSDLRRASTMLHEIQKGLHDYLEKKRIFFPRFYFLSNDELLEILSKTKEPERIQPHLRKCFDGINKLVFSRSQDIKAMVSIENEVVQFQMPVYTSESNGMVELWMSQVADAMKDTLVHLVRDAVSQFQMIPSLDYLEKFPGQALSCACFINWTQMVDLMLERKQNLRILLEKCTEVLEYLAQLLEKQTLNPVTRMAVSNLVVFYLYARDIANQMVEQHVSNPFDFQWQSRLRYYWNSEANECLVRMMSSQVSYGFEYIGNTQRLAMTPLTEKCFRTTLLALSQFKGSWLYGDPCTGKTSIVKELAHALAKQCLVFNCFDGMDSSAIGRILKGVAQTGAWSCLDEFDRLDVDKASVIANQIKAVQQASARNLRRIIFENSDINLVPGCAVFLISSSCFKMPENIKQLFRSIAVDSPDVLYIAETLLTSYGFRKPGIATEFKKLMESAQEIHPDICSPNCRLRIFKAILNTAGDLKQFHPNLAEEDLLRQALTLYLRPRLSSKQLEFLGSTSELEFQASQNPSQWDRLLPILEATSRELNLEPSIPFLEKAAQLFNSLVSNAGVILAGEAMSGKSSLFKIVVKAYPKILEHSGEEIRVVHQVISPWIFPAEQLFGYEDPKKKDWIEGILTKTLRELSAGSPTSPRWIVLDGCINAQWACHLHTLLDSSRKLTLPSGDILQIPQSLRIIFETSNLVETSPATVSRCSVIHVPDDVVSVKDLLKSWLRSIKLSTSSIEQIVNCIIIPLLEFVVEENMSVIVVSTRKNLFQSFTRLLSALIGDNQQRVVDVGILSKICIFAATWTIGNLIKKRAREQFEIQIRTLIKESQLLSTWDLNEASVLPPDGHSLFSYCCDLENGGHWVPWRDFIPNLSLKTGRHLTDSLVVTESAVIQRHLLKIYVAVNVPVLIAGENGSGKSLVTRWTMDNLVKDRFLKNFIHLTAQTDSEHLQNCIMNGLDRRRKGVYGPTLGRRCILVIDDLSTPVPVHRDIRPALELLRHWLDHDYLYESSSGSRIELVDMNLVALLSLEDSDRLDIDARVLRHMNVLVIDPLKEETLRFITEKILESCLGQFYLTKTLAEASVALYVKLAECERERSKSPVQVQTWDLAKMAQGILAVPLARLKDPGHALKAWIHESCRVFGDRLVSERDKAFFLKVLEYVGKIHFKESVRKFFMGHSSSVSLPFPDIQFCAQPFKSADFTYDEIGDVDEVTASLESIVEEYNAASQTPLRIVVSHYVAAKVAQISRALSVIKGHVILLGPIGSGRKSCAILAAMSSGFEISQVDIGAKFEFLEWREHLKNLAGNCGLRNRKTVLIIKEENLKFSRAFDDLARLMSCQEIPDLFSLEEKISIAESQQKDNKSDDFAKRVRQNLRIVICVSPINSFYTERLPLYNKIHKYSTTISFDNWPDEMLESIAKKYLDRLHFPEPLLSTHVSILRQIHNSAFHLDQSSASCLQITPSSYVTLIDTFRQLYLAKQEELSSQRDRYNAGLSKLQFAASQVCVMQEELQRLQPQLVDTSAETEALMVKIEQDTIEVEAQKEVIAADEALANEAAAAAQAIKDECESDLAEATPALEAAVNALNTLKPSDITLVKAMRHPPNTVKLVMEAVCIMKDIAPVKRKDRSGSGKLVDDYWIPAQKLLGDLKFLDSLRAYDKDNISPHIMKKIRDCYIPNPDFDPNMVRHVSAACEGLCRWVRAVEVYDRVVKIVAPKRAKVKEAEKELSMQMARLSEKHLQLQQISDKLQALNDDFAAMSKKKKDLEDSIKQCCAKLQRAEKLIGSLGGEQERWKSTTDHIELKLKQLPAHILISAALITYTGSCDRNKRQECVKAWLSIVASQEIPHETDFSLVGTLANTQSTDTWISAGIPSDDYSLDNAIIVRFSQRWPLIIDPQGQVLKWVMKIHEKSKVRIVKHGDAELIKLVNASLDQGEIVLLQDVQEALPAQLNNLVSKVMFTKDGERFVTVGESCKPMSAEFRLFIVISDEKCNLDRHFTSKFTMVNFQLNGAGLEEKLLNLLLSVERPELEDRKQLLSSQSSANQRQGHDLEDKILHVLTSSCGNILEDESATRILYNSKMQVEDLKARQMEIEKSQAEIEETCLNYRPVAQFAAALFAAVGRLKLLDSFYNFSIDYLISIYKRSITESRRSAIITERIFFIKEHLTKSLFGSICRALQLKDRLTFALVLALEVIRDRDKCTNPCLDLLLDDIPYDLSSSIPGLKWMSQEQWNQVRFIAKRFPALRSLPQHIEADWSAWDKGLRKLVLPQPFDQIHALEKLLIIKCLQPSSLNAAFRLFLKTVLGPSFLECPVNDVEGIYEDSLPSTPILCAVADQGDPAPHIVSLCELKTGVKNKVKTLSLANTQANTALTFVRRCMFEGNWVVINNCRLNHGELELIVEAIRLEHDALHPEFRIWFVSDFSLPDGKRIFEHCLKLVYETPNNFRDALLQVLKLNTLEMRSASRDSEENGPAEGRTEEILNTERWSRILFTLSCFHALLVERKKYGQMFPVTWNDLQLAVDILKDENLSIVSMRAIVKDCVYGVRVSNKQQEDIVKRFITTVFSSNMFQIDYVSASLCGTYKIPFNLNRTGKMDFVRTLPVDLGPAAVGILEEDAQRGNEEIAHQVLRGVKIALLR